MKFLLLPIVALLASGCAKSGGSGPAAASPSAVASAGWSIYEDDWVRAMYPDGSEVLGAPDGRQDPKAPQLMITPPTAEPGTAIGAMAIQLDSKSKGMLLRDAIQSEIQDERNRRAVILAGPRDISPKNARCIGILVNAPDNGCAKGQASCYQPYIRTLCDGPDGRRYDILGILSRGSSPKALGAGAQRQAAVYERIVNSLEFKKS